MLDGCKTPEAMLAIFEMAELAPPEEYHSNA